jgi:hypothetical protein
MLFSGARLEVEGATPEGAVPPSSLVADESVSSLVATGSEALPSRPVAAVTTDQDLVINESPHDAMVRQVLVRAPRASQVEIYVQPRGHRTTYYLGSAWPVAPSEYVYSLALNLLPVGEYVLFARYQTNDGTRESSRVAFMVAREISPPVSRDTPTTAVLNPESVETATTVPNLAPALENAPARRTYAQAYFTRAWSSTALATATLPTAVVSGEVNTLLRARVITELADDVVTLNALYLRYASVYQTSNPTLRAAWEALRARYQAQVVSALITDSDLPVTVSDVTLEVEAELKLLTAFVESQELAFGEAAREASRRDADGDGLPDRDETRYYSTDPTIYDTDQDGVPDGIAVLAEIAVFDGSDGTDFPRADQVTVMTATVDGTLAIDRVDPLRETDPTRAGQGTALAIQGRAHPYSFIRIGVFSDPTLGLVQARADGTFSLDLVAPLTDGTHQVMAFSVDREGVPVSRSEPVRIVLEAGEISLPPDDQALPETTPGHSLITSPTELYKVILALTVAALGFLLLFVSSTLQRRRSPVAGNQGGEPGPAGA